MQVFNIDECDPQRAARLEQQAEADFEYFEQAERLIAVEAAGRTNRLERREAEMAALRELAREKSPEEIAAFEAETDRLAFEADNRYRAKLPADLQAEFDRIRAMPDGREQRTAFERLDADAQLRAEWARIDALTDEESDLELTKKESAVSVVPFPVPAAPIADFIKTSGEFVRGFVPPEYVLDGVLQRRFCYSMTAQTGVGKTTVAMLLSAHISLGRPLGALDVAKGTVIYLAGENPTDVQMRWLGLTQELKMDPLNADVHFIPGVLPLSQVATKITAEVMRKGLRPVLVVVDTAAAYNESDDENSNTQLGAHARRLRSLTELPGGPCVLILCHPTKRAADDDLIPRGGGAFLAEVDGNIALQKRDTLIVAGALGKFRGAEFPPLRFELKTVREHPILKDTRGRNIPTVVARPVDESAATVIEASGERDEDTVLRALPAQREAGLNPTEIARKLKWYIRNDPKQPAHLKVKRTLDCLRAHKLAEAARNNRWRLMPKGELELNRLDTDAKAASVMPPLPMR